MVVLCHCTFSLKGGQYLEDLKIINLHFTYISFKDFVLNVKKCHIVHIFLNVYIVVLSIRR
jgi:hypothetical protein